MEISKAVEGNKVIVALSGRMVTTNCDEVRPQLLQLIEETDELILDLQKLEFMASSGLRIVLELAKRMKQKGGNFTVKNPTPVVQDVLDMTGLSAIINIIKE